LNDTAVDPAAQLRIDEHMVLLQRHAKRLHARYGDVIELEELVSHGYVGLRQAAQRFEPSYGVPFERYAWYRIDGEMRRAVKGQLQVTIRAREAGRQALALLGDDADVMNDDDARHKRRLSDYCDAVFAAMLAGAVSQASASAGRGYEQADDRLDLSQAQESLAAALDAVEDALAVIVRRHYLEGERLRDIAKDLDVSYATVRRRHQAALTAVGKALRALRSEQREAG
jgi:RNA polymerase sigma factor for flagellar operon FliA